MSLDNKQIVDKLVNGSSLYTVMVPDPAIPTNNPEHIEGFHLNHIIMNGEYFWGLSGGGVLFENLESTSFGRFAYTNINNVFLSMTVFANKMNMMDIRRYKEHNWHIKDDHELIWDWTGDRDNNVIKEAIESSRPLKIAMLDSEGVWNIHPVEITYYRVKDDTFSIRTTLVMYPINLRYPEKFIAWIQENEVDAMLDSLTKDNFEKAAAINSPVNPFTSSLLIEGDGTYKTAYDQLRENSVQTYQEMKIFALKQGGEITSTMQSSSPHLPKE